MEHRGAEGHQRHGVLWSYTGGAGAVQADGGNVTLLIDNDVVKKVLKMDECIQTQEDAFRGLLTRDSVHRSRIDVYVPTERDDDYYRWGTMEGSVASLGVHAIRLKSDVISWPTDAQGGWTEEKYCSRPGLFCGLILLFSTRNGEPLAIINDGQLQHMRVAAGAGIGAKYLARENARVVGMIGSGGMARTFLQAFCCVRDIREVRVYSPNQAHREAYAEEMGPALGIEVLPVDRPEDAARGADIVSTCTDSMAPVLDSVWLEPGMHITCLGPFEWGQDVVARATVAIRQGLSGVIPTDPEQRIGVGRGHSPVAYIAGSDDQVARIPGAKPTMLFETADRKMPQITDLFAGRTSGRSSGSDITAYSAAGYQGLQFAAAGWLAYHRAKQQGLGRELPTEWFLQDIRD